MASQADAPTVTVDAASGLEDGGPIALDIDAAAAAQDVQGEVTGFTISDIPVGATLNLGGGFQFTATEGNTSVNLSPAMVENLSIDLPEDFDENFSLQVSATAQEVDPDTGAVTTSTSDPVSLAVEVGAVADAPTVDVSNASGTEDGGPIALDIDPAAAAEDINGEVVSVTISGVPEGATLSAGAFNAETGEWTVDAADVDGLTVSLPEDFDEDFTLQVSATAQETDPETGAVTTATSAPVALGVSVAAQVDAPTVTVDAAAGDEDTAIALNIDADAAAQDINGEVTGVTISGIPAGATLTLPGGLTFTASETSNSVTLTPAQLEGLTITPLADSSDDFQLTVTATATETDPDTGAVTTATSAPATLDVTVQGVADGAQVTDTTASGVEDTAIPFTVDVSELDTDGSETLSVTLSNIPEGAVITRNGEALEIVDGQVTLGEGELDGLAILPPADFSGDLDLTVSATTTDEGDVSETALGTVSIDVAGQADGAALNVAATSGDEDTGIALPISIDKADESETAEITLSGIPEGAVLSNTSGPISVVDGIAVLTEADLAGLQITPPADSDADFNLGVSVVTTDGVSTSDPATGTIAVGVDGVADVPTLAVDSAVSGTEDGGPIALDIASSLTDVDGSESLSITISGVPDDATLSAGTKNEDGTWTLSSGDLDGLSVTPGADSGEDFQLTVTATSTEADGGDTASQTATIDVSVASQADAPTVTVDAAAGDEDTAIALNIDAEAAAQDINGEVTGVTISGIPAGATLTLPGGLTFTASETSNSVTLTPAQLEGLTITPLADSSDDFQLTITATAQETDPDTGDVTTATSAPATLDVTVQGVADGAQVADTTASGAEDTAIPLTIDVTELDTDGSETLSVTLSNIPEGAVITRNGEVLEVVEGTVTLAEGELDGLEITPPTDFAGNFDITVSATTTDEGDVSETATGTISVDVSGGADGAAVTLGSAQGDEDTFIDLPISIDKADESETAQITLSGIPQGAVLSNANGPINVTDGVAVLSEADLAGLQIKAPTNSGADFPLNVSVVTTDGNSTSDPATGTINVGVDAVADVPTLTVGSVTGTEDSAIPLNISAGLNDTDGSEVLSITISDVPPGAVLTLADGSSFTATPENTTFLFAGDQLEGLTITPPENSDADFSLNVVATSLDTDPDTGAVTTSSVEGAMTVNVDPDADAPTLVLDNAAGDEDSAIALSINAALTDASEVLSVTISDIPEGATLTLANGTEFTASEGNTSYDIDPSDLAGLTITPPDDSNEDFNLTVTATSTESDGSTSTTSSALNVNVTGVADLPTLSVTLGDGTPGTTGGGEGGGYVIDTSGAVDLTGNNAQTHQGTTGDDMFVVNRNLNGNENFIMKTGNDTVIVNGNTAGGTNFNMSEGNDTVVINGNIGGNTNVNGSGQNDVLILGKPSDRFEFRNYTESASGLINTQIVDLDTGQTLTVNNVEAIAFGDGEYRGNADLLPQYDTGGESVVTYPLDITSELQDIDGSETLSITVSGLPEGAVLSAGQPNEDGSWTLDPSDLADLTLTVPSTAESFGLSVTATSTEDDGDTASISTSVGVTVDDIASDPSLNLTDAAGMEDLPIPLDISAALTDTDGSESLSITLSGIPDGAVLRSGDTVLVVENGEITFEDGVVPDSLTIQAPGNSDEDFALTVSATSTESSTGDQSTVSSTLNVAVSGVADAPTLTVDLGAGEPVGGSEEVPGSVTITNAAQGEAGYHNTYGYYVIGEDGAPQSGQIIWADVKDSVGDTFTLDGVDPEDIGFFVIPNGDDLNNNLSDGMDVTFTQGQDGNWHVVGPNGQVLSGEGDPVLFDDPTLNEGNFDYTQDTNAPGNQSWEDLVGGGDNDFNDIHIQVDTVPTQPGTGGQEFVEYPLNVNALLTDTDGSETLSATLSGMPAGSVVTLADGTEFTITSPTSGVDLTSTQLQGITLTVPAGSEDFNLHVTATATEADGDTATVSTSVGVDVPVFDNEASDPTLTVSDAAGLEDGIIPLDIAAALTDTDDSESLTVTLSGIPDGAVLKSGDTILTVDNGSITFADGVVPENLTIQPPANSGADFDITVSATSTEENGGDTSTTTGTINVAVAAVADTVALDVSDAVIDEGATTVPLDISAQLGDLDGSEELTVTISGIPEGVTLSGGEKNSDGSWTLSGDDLQDLTMTLPSGESTTSTLYSQNFNSLSDGTTAAGGDNGFSSTGGYSGNDDRTAVDNDRFEFQNPTGGDISTWSSAEVDISGQEDVSFSFNLKGYGDMESSGSAADYFKVIAVVDGVEHELMTHNGDLDNWSTITLDDIPQGDSLVIKMEVRTTGSDEVYKMDNLSIEGTSTTTAAPVEDFNLEITATAADTDPDTGAISYSSTEANLLVTVAAEDDASAPTVTVSDAAGAEDTPIALDITAALTDLDGSEAITSITLSGIPAGATLNHGTLDEVTGDWSVELSDLVDLEVTPAPNSNEDFEITVSVTSTESNGGATATTTATIDVDVTGVVDDFTVAASDAAGAGGDALPLDISVDLTDLDGSETVSVTLTGIPEGATLNHGTFDEGSGNWTLSGDDLDGLTISLPETVEGEGGGEPVSLYSQNFNDLSNYSQSADGANGFTTDGSAADIQGVHGVYGDAYYFGQSTSDAYDDSDVNQWNSAPIDISGQEDVTFSFNLQAHGDLEESGSYHDFFTVIAVVDGVEHEVLVKDGNFANGHFEISDIPAGNELIIRMEAKTTSSDEYFSMDNVSVVGTPAAAEPLESFQIGVETTVTESDGASETQSTTLNVEINNDDEAEAPTLTVTEQAPTTEDVAVALNIAAALTDTDGSETLSVTLSGIPDGAVLQSGGQTLAVANGEITFADGIIPQGLTIQPPANSNEDFQLTVSAISTEENGGDTSTTTATIDVDVTGVVDDFTVAAHDATGEAGTELPLSIDVGLTDLDGSETVSVTLTGIPEGATLNHGTFDEGSGNWTLSSDDLDGLTISLPETVEGEGGGEPATLYSQNFNDTFDGQTAAGGDNGFSSTGGSWGNDDRTAADNDRFEFQNPSGGDISTFTTAAIDISGQEDVSFSFNLKGYGDLDSSGSHADYFKVIAVVDGVEHELMTENGDVEDWTTFTLDNIPQGDELIIKMEVRTTGDDEKYKMDNLKVEGTPAAAEPLESFQIGVETTVTESDGASETQSTTLNVEINNDDEAEAPTLTVTEQAPTTEDVAVALNIAAALTDTDGSETLSVTLSGIPDGAVLKSGDTVLTVENGEITFADGVVPNDLSLTPPTNSDADIELTVSATSTEANGGATTTTTSTIDIDVSALADVPTITSVTIGTPVITEGTEGVAETVTISSANFGESDAGFSIAARTINSNGTLSEASADNVSTNGSPLGFGVAGNASGDNSELGYDNQHGVSEELIVTFDDDVSSVDVAFAWMHSGEQAGYKLFRDGVEVGSGTVNGVTDNIDDPVTLSTTDGGTFDQIVFTAPGNDDDYLINSISFETPSGMPDVAEYPIDIVAGLADTDGSEDLSITIGGVPEGASLSAGTDNGDGTWTVSGGDLEGLSLSVPFEDEVEAFDLTFTATATEQSNNSMATSAAVVVAAAAVVAPEPEPEPVEEDFDGLDMDGEDNNNDEMVGGDTSSDDWTGNYQAQTYAGSTKNDDLNTGGGGDTLYGGAGNDELTGSWGNDTFFGGSGNDELDGGDGNDLLVGGSGSDEIEGGTGDDEIQGGSGNDEIEGGHGNDLLYGGAGNDDIEGGTGHDTVYGGSGNDEIEGNDGNDLLYGGSGNDEIEGGSGHDTVYGGAGNDEIEGNDGNDLLYGGSGDDEIEGGSGHDTVHGGSGDDEIEGNDGNDLLYGGSGNDQIEGGDGHDQLFGGLGDDFLAGGSGNDTLFGGAGNDVLNGGSGNDTFIFDADSGHDIIEDIMLQDTLEFQGEQFDMNDMIFSENEDGDAVISFAGKDDMSVTLEGVKFDDLDRNGDGDASEGYSVTQSDDGFTVNIDDT